VIGEASGHYHIKQLIHGLCDGRLTQAMHRILLKPRYGLLRVGLHMIRNVIVGARWVGSILACQR
jgi:hypothetical protein